MNGQYIGFIHRQNIFSWNGNYLGSIDNQDYVWDRTGGYAGKLLTVQGSNYILRNTLLIMPVSKSPKTPPLPPSLPSPQAQVAPIQMPIGWEDVF